MYKYTNLDRSTATAYQHLTFPSLRSQLTTIDRHKNLVAIGAQIDSQPVGLIMAEIDPDNSNTAEILSLFVIPNCRRLGIGKELLNQLINELTRQKCQALKIIYISKDLTAPLPQFLQATGWLDPALRMVICSELVAKIANATWLKLDTKMPPGYTIFPWIELTKSEQKKLAAATWYPSELSPFQEPDTLENSNSLGLRYHDEIVGWTIAHRVDATAIRYTALFVREELQSIGRGIGLLGKAIQIQLDRNEVPKAIFTVLADNAKMVKFAERRIAPYVNSEDFIRYSWSRIKEL
jgi:GNAT superfamily N-acetyltransferase